MSPSDDHNAVGFRLSRRNSLILQCMAVAWSMVIAFGLTWHVSADRSDEAEVLWLTRRLLNAWNEGDFETVWDLTSDRTREEFRLHVIPPVSPDEAPVGWARLVELTGLEVTALTKMEPGEIYAAAQEVDARYRASR